MLPPRVIDYLTDTPTPGMRSPHVVGQYYLRHIRLLITVALGYHLQETENKSLLLKTPYTSEAPELELT